MEGQQTSETQLKMDGFDSLFLLKKWSDSTRTSVSIAVDFSSGCNMSLQPDSLLTSMPVFNPDQKHYTPAFVVQLDKPKYSCSEHLYMALHNRKTVEMLEQKTELFVPRPSKNSSFCCVCKATYADYLTHLASPQHIALLRNSSFCQHINDLCAHFGNNEVVEFKQDQRKTKKIARNVVVTRRKKIKEQEPSPAATLD